MLSKPTTLIWKPVFVSYSFSTASQIQPENRKLSTLNSAIAAAMVSPTVPKRNLYDVMGVAKDPLKYFKMASDA